MSDGPIAISKLELENALRDGKLWVKMNNGNWWQARRNGMTKTWKREPSRFEVPVKFGLRGTARLTDDDAATSFPKYYLIASHNPNPKRK